MGEHYDTYLHLCYGENYLKTRKWQNRNKRIFFSFIFEKKSLTRSLSLLLFHGESSLHVTPPIKVVQIHPSSWFPSPLLPPTCNFLSGSEGYASKDLPQVLPQDFRLGRIRFRTCVSVPSLGRRRDRQARLLFLLTAFDDILSKSIYIFFLFYLLPSSRLPFLCFTD